jgi:hypothetical protein
MAYVTALAERTSESSFGRWCAKVGDLLDCAIPIALVIVLVVGSTAMALGVF